MLHVTICEHSQHSVLARRDPLGTRIWLTPGKWLRDAFLSHCPLRVSASNPGIASPTELSKVHYIYRQPVCDGLIVAKAGILFLHKLFKGNDNTIKLQLVPASLQDIVFVAFHANPIGGHLSAYKTYQKIRLRYFWPHLYKYCGKIAKACPGCSMAKLTRHISRKLVYSFPITAPMNIPHHVEIFVVGTEFNFDGNKYYLIASCSMTTFSICEPTAE